MANCGIAYIKEILNKNGSFLTHKQLKFNTNLQQYSYKLYKYRKVHLGYTYTMETNIKAVHQLHNQQKR